MTTSIIKLQLIAIMIIGGFSQLNLLAQESFEKEVMIKKGQAVKLKFDFADSISIKTWNKPQLYITARVKHKLKEKLNFQLLELNKHNEIEIKEKVKNLKNLKNINISGKQLDDNIFDIDYEIYLPDDVKLIVNSLSGNIDVKGMNNSLILETLSGFVDVSIDPSKGYDLMCSTMTGSIYSDLKFNSNENAKNKELITSLNGGGKMLKLETISGDIYLREKK